MTRMFTLQEEEAHLSNVNHRIEKFGDEGNKLACDLEISFETGNDYLEHFDPDLKPSLYKRPDKPDLADIETHMPVLKFTSIERLAWKQEWVNCEMTIHRLKDDIVLKDCKVNKVRIEPAQGGSVTVKFRVQFYPDPTKPTIMGKIDAMLEDGGITISLSRPLDDAPEAVSNDPVQNPVERNARKKKPHETNPEMFADPDSALH